MWVHNQHEPINQVGNVLESMMMMVVVVVMMMTTTS
jgi:hypothetical protein